MLEQQESQMTGFYLLSPFSSPSINNSTILTCQIKHKKFHSLITDFDL